jgi:CHASE1-domain containing sensor protein
MDSPSEKGGRRISTRIVFTAAGLCAAALLWRFAAAPAFRAMPDDYRYVADVVSYDDWFDEDSGVFSGPLKSESRLTCYRIGEEDGAATLSCLSQLFSSETGRPALTIERRYAIDPGSWEHVPGNPAADRSREGSLFAPPGLDVGDRFTYWHPTYDAAAGMNFAGEESLLGLRVFRYVADFGEERIDQTEALAHLNEVGRTRGVAVRPELEVWVEPKTGTLVKHLERGEAYYYDLETGEALAPLERYSTRSSVLSVVEQVERVRGELVWRWVIDWAAPLALLLAAGATLIFGCTQCREEYRRLAVRWVPAAALGGTLVASMFGAYAMHDAFARRSDSRMSADAARVSDALFSRLSVYANVLYGARGLFYASDSVSRSEWSAYSRSLNLRSLYPGVLGVGFALLVPDWRLAQHEGNVRAEGYPGYNVRPQSPSRSLYSPVVFLEPHDSENAHELGNDLLADPVRRVAMERARDEDAVVASSLIHLARENGEAIDPGFGLFLPVYGPGDSATLAGRRESIMGYAFSQFRTYRLVEDSMTDNDYALRFEVFAGENETREARRLFDSDPTAILRVDRAIVETVDVFGTPWTLRFSGLSGYGLTTFERMLPWLTLALGTLFSVGLYAALVFSGRSRLMACNACPPFRA